MIECVAFGWRRRRGREVVGGAWGDVAARVRVQVTVGCCNLWEVLWERGRECGSREVGDQSLGALCWWEKQKRAVAKERRIEEPPSTREFKLPLLYGKGGVGLSNSQATAVGT